MRKPVQSVLFVLCLLASSVVYCQAPATVKHGPSGIFIFLGKEIPCGKNVSSIKIERSEDNIHWKQIKEVKTPSQFSAFTQAIEKAKADFPAQPIPPVEKLSALYQKAVETGNVDSLKGMRLLFPIRVALGIMYYDTSASKNITYNYRISAIKALGEKSGVFVSDTITLPFRAQFDSITFSESSYNIKSVSIKWKSTGKNPAPLFMVFKFKMGAPVVAHGAVSRYNINDTTYYAYYDTTVGKEAGKELQYFVSPYDQYGNSGRSSQVAVITQDNFNKATFVRNAAAYNGDPAGVLVRWHFTDPITVKSIEIYRSESPETGFTKFATAAATDTSFLDQKLWPMKTYYYYIQAVAKAGRRTKQSEILNARIPGISFNIQLQTPVLHQVAVVNKNIRLLIEVKDTIATHIRIYRGVKDGLTALPGLINTDNSGYVEFVDSTLAPADMKDVFYAVRNEKAGTGISSLSEAKPVAMVPDVNDIAYFHAFPAKGVIKLYWDDVLNRKSEYSSYTLARHYGPENSKSPLMILDDKLTGSSFTDDKVQKGNQYTYVLNLVDKSGNSSKTYTVTVQSSNK